MEEEKNKWTANGSIPNQGAINDIYLPVSIFTNGASSLESISKYLKDNMGLRYCAIADILNRDDRTIWGAHKSANIKSENFSAEESNVRIPVSIFFDRKFSILEAIAVYLKENLNMRFCGIAAILNKNQRTVWTVYSRAMKKRRQNGQA